MACRAFRAHVGDGRILELPLAAICPELLPCECEDCRPDLPRSNSKMTITKVDRERRRITVTFEAD
jgi:hypothetical protein